MGERAAACWLLRPVRVGPPGLRAPPGAGPQPGIALTADLARADALVRRGSYASLQDALAIYERLAATGDAPAAALRAIDTALLLALRERELGLAGGRSLERAVELANRQPPPYDIGVFLSVAESQAWHAGGVSKERPGRARCRRSATMFESWPAWRAQLSCRRRSRTCCGRTSCSPSTAPAVRTRATGRAAVDSLPPARRRCCASAPPSARVTGRRGGPRRAGEERPRVRRDAPVPRRTGLRQPHAAHGREAPGRGRQGDARACRRRGCCSGTSTWRSRSPTWPATRTTG